MCGFFLPPKNWPLFGDCLRTHLWWDVVSDHLCLICRVSFFPLLIKLSLQLRHELSAFAPLISPLTLPVGSGRGRAAGWVPSC